MQKKKKKKKKKKREAHKIARDDFTETFTKNVKGKNVTTKNRCAQNIISRTIF